MDAAGFADAVGAVRSWLPSGSGVAALRSAWEQVPGLAASPELLAAAAHLRDPASAEHERWLWGTIRYDLGAHVVADPGREWRLRVPAAETTWANANTRHGSKWGEAACARRWREHAWGLAARQVQQGGLPQRLGYAAVHIWVQPATYGKRDLDNWAGICKRVVDALGPPTPRADGSAAPGAGVLVGDDFAHLSGPHRHWWHTAFARRRTDPAGALLVKIIDLSD